LDYQKENIRDPSRASEDCIQVVGVCRVVDNSSPSAGLHISWTITALDLSPLVNASTVGRLIQKKGQES